MRGSSTASFQGVAVIYTAISRNETRSEGGWKNESEGGRFHTRNSLSLT